MCLFQIWGADTHAPRNKTKCLTFLSAQMRLTVTCNCLAVVGGAPSRCQSSSVESENLNFYDDNIMFNAFFPFLALPGLRLQILLLMCLLVSVPGSLLLRLQANTKFGIFMRARLKRITLKLVNVKMPR